MRKFWLDARLEELTLKQCRWKVSGSILDDKQRGLLLSGPLNMIILFVVSLFSFFEKEREREKGLCSSLVVFPSFKKFYTIMVPVPRQTC